MTLSELFELASSFTCQYIGLVFTMVYRGFGTVVRERVCTRVLVRG